MSPSLIVAGGTGLYLKALTDGLDSDASDPACRARWQSLFEREGPAALQRALAERAPGALETLVAPSNPRRLIRALEHLETRGCLPQQWKRTPPAAPVTVLRLPREQLHARIARRVAAMFGQGLVDEVRALRQTYPVWSPTAAAAIGYAEAGAVLDGTLTLREAAERIVIRTRQLAKRQETWFRHQTQAVWLEIDDNDPPERVARRVLDTWRQHGPTPLVRP
jgi:tRNA dimethylallyltransferase